MNDFSAVNKCREFNRFYSLEMDFLSRDHLHTGFSIPQIRVLYEIGLDEETTPSALALKLHMDKSYMSRILAGFEKKGMIELMPSKSDGRSKTIVLTQKGWALRKTAEHMTNLKIAQRIEHLDQSECERLEQAMDTIMELLGKGGTDDESGTVF